MSFRLFNHISLLGTLGHCSLGVGEEGLGKALVDINIPVGADFFGQGDRAGCFNKEVWSQWFLVQRWRTHKETMMKAEGLYETTTDMNKDTFTCQLFFCVECLAALARRLGVGRFGEAGVLQTHNSDSPGSLEQN